MRGIDIKRRILAAYENGFKPEQIINGQWNPTFPVKKTKPRFFVAQFFRPIFTTTAPTNPKPNPHPISKSNDDKPKEDSALKESSTKPTPMDIDIAKRRMQTLKELASIYGDDYITNNLSYHCEEPGKESLKLERRVFYKLFGTKPEARELIALFIANLTSSGNPCGIEIINGLIKYFEKFTKWLNYNLKSFNSTQVYKSNKLFEKYLRFGREEVYKLLDSISKKITVKCNGIKNENIFPVIGSEIHKIFASLRPIPF